ncbi:MAG: protein kinase [Acidobacteria bacterium]|nr:protein kinase [Acidobacteriota bacterium]
MLAQSGLGASVPPTEEIMEQVKTDPLLGREIAGRYRIEAKIGEGGMGSVYRARNVATGKVVAIKVLLQDLAAYDSFVQRFLHEAQAAAYLNHPHAINIIDCGRDGDVVYLLMEYVEGRTLTEVMREEGPFPAERAANILRQICAAVAEAHGQSIVHRDLKPDNIMLQRVAGGIDYVKVLDFGIAKVLDEQKRGSAPISRNIFVGTPEYASPEQCNAKSPTHLSDIYSLGTILYEMLTGNPPFTGDPMQVMISQVSGEPRAVREIRSDLSPQVEDVLKRALSKDPADRQQHVLQLAQEFEAAVFGGVEEAWDLNAPGRDSVPVRPTAFRPQLTQPATLAPERRGWQSWWLFQTGRRRLLAGLVSVTVMLGMGAGYRFYRWYQLTPVLPKPPQLALPQVPRLQAHPLELARRLFESGNRDGAVGELKRLITNDQGFNPEAHALLGLVYFDQGDYSGAESEYNTAIKQMDGVYPEAQCRLGQLLLDRGNEAEAATLFQQAVDGSERQHLPSLLALGELALHRDEPDRAEEMFREVISRASDTSEDILQVGRVLLLRHQYDLAARELRRAISSRQGVFPEAELYLGLTLAKQADLKGAIEALKQAVAHRGGNYPDGRVALGMALYEHNEYSQAIEELKAAVRLRGGNDPQAELWLGILLADWAVGRYDEALAQLQLAITHRGGRFPEAEQAMARLYFTRLGQLAEARKIWGQRDDQSWLEQTKDALFIRSGSGTSTQRVIGGKSAGAGDSMTFSLAPVAGGSQAPIMTVKVDAGGVTVRFIPGEESRPPRWSALVFGPGGERSLDVQPIENQLMGKTSTEISVRIGRMQASLVLDGQEVWRGPVEPSVQVLAVIGDGEAVLYNWRESKGVDIH